VLTGSPIVLLSYSPHSFYFGNSHIPLKSLHAILSACGNF